MQLPGMEEEAIMRVRMDMAFGLGATPRGQVTLRTTV
jgi:hypothetical protein